MKSISILYKFLKRIGILGYSRKKNIFGVHAILVSILFIVLTASIACLARKLAKRLLKDSIAKNMVLEFVATAELCAVCYELIIDNYGVSTYALFLFLLTIWWSLAWENATACPYNSMEDVLERQKSAKEAMLLVLAQILGGAVIFKYVQILWSLELVETHRGRAYEECAADLNVSMICGAIIEAVATFLCRITSRSLGDSNLRYATVLDAFFATTLVVAAFNYSGGYYNPILASSLKFGCDGHTFAEHMVVYWFGAIAGSLASVVVYRVHEFTYTEKEKVE